MEKNTFLFIGGPLDGQVITLQRPGYPFRAAVNGTPLSMVSGSPSRFPHPVSTIDYRPYYLTTEDASNVFYIPEDMTGQQAIELLAANYRPDKQEAA